MDLTPTHFFHFAGWLAVAVFAVSGALAAAEKRLDILGFILFGTVTGIGGGTVRDLILGVDVFWVVNPIDLHICIIAAVLTYFTAPHFIARQRWLLWMDAMGLALFSVVGTAKAYSLGVDPVVACTMGMITPTFGSVIRDLLLDREPLLLGPEIYVTAALAGGVSYLLLALLALPEDVILLIAIAIAFTIRALAILRDLRLPKFSR